VQVDQAVAVGVADLVERQAVDGERDVLLVSRIETPA
jgi:hypothetical protein